MIDRPEDEIRAPEATEGARLPPVTDRASWQAQVNELLVREKAHTREGDAIAAARRRLPMVEVDSSIPVVGERGHVRLLDVFEGRRQLAVYYHMWEDGKSAEQQCAGCTFFNGQVSELSYLHARDVTYATFSQGPYEESAAYRRFMGYDMPWYSARESEEPLLAGRWFGIFASYLREGDRVFETYWTRPAEARRRWPRRMGYSTGRSMAARNRSRTRQQAGRSTGRTTVASSARTAARVRSGRAGQPAAPTCSRRAGRPDGRIPRVPLAAESIDAISVPLTKVSGGISWPRTANSIRGSDGAARLRHTFQAGLRVKPPS